MWTRLLQGLMNRRPTKLYRYDDLPLFYRAYLFSFCGWVFYLHKYMMSDPDRGLHNHPFKALAIVLSTGYWEDRLIGLDDTGLVIKTKRVNPGSFNFIHPYTYHRLILNENDISWSLFICKYVKKDWGFLESNSDYPSFFKFRKYDRTGDRFWWKSAPKGKIVCKS